MAMPRRDAAGIFALRNRRGVAVVSVLCGAAWAAAQPELERLISIDLVLYGSSLLLEFAALGGAAAARAELSGLQGRQFWRCLYAGRGSSGVDRYASMPRARRR